MRMMGLAKWCGTNGDAKRNNRRNLAAPPTVERSVLLIGVAHKQFIFVDLPSGAT
jgi:hypothetical protein